ncbi:MAG: hypothetical protein Q8936_10735 [Bacillota bacterium]|nr:hypothetical protein [Bacillota bacterium]
MRKEFVRISISQVAELKDYRAGIKIVNGYAYYSTENDRTVRVKINEKQ